MANPEGNVFQLGLGRAAANFAPLSPLGFLPRAASIYPERVAMIHGDRRIVYSDFDLRTRRLASALARRGIGPGDTVSAVLPNVPATLDAHFGVPMIGAVLNTINTRLDARTIAYILEHGEAKVLLTDPPSRSFAESRWSSRSTTRSTRAQATGSARSSTKRSWPRAPTTSRGRRRPMRARRSRSTTPRGPPVTRRASSTITGGPSSNRSATS